MSGNSDNLKGWMSDEVQGALSKIDMGTVFEPMNDKPNSSNEECPCLRVDASGVCPGCGNDVLMFPDNAPSGNASDLAKRIRAEQDTLKRHAPKVWVNVDRLNFLKLLDEFITLLPSTERVSIDRELFDRTLEFVEADIETPSDTEAEGSLYARELSKELRATLEAADE